MEQPLPTDFQIRVRQRLAALGISANQASLRAGLSRETVRKLLELGAGLPRGKTLKQLAAALETSEAWLLEDESPESPETSVRQVLRTAGEVPIRGTVAGSHHQGSFQLYDNKIGHAELPAGLKHHADVYAIVVVNDSMVPEHKPGEMRFVTPHVKPKRGDSVVIEFERDPDLGPEAMIGHLISQGNTVKIGKLNPPDIVEVDARSISKLHRIASESELRDIE